VTHYDVVVIGGGTMGTAAAWELGKRGLSAAVFEQFEHVHPHGAHSGQTRVIRHAYAEGPDYVPFVMRADDLWMELEQATGETVFHRVGVLEMSAPGNDHAQLARASAQAHGIPFEWLTPDEIRRRFPQFRVELALRAMAAEARRLGVEIHEQTPIEKWSLTPQHVTIHAGGFTHSADRAIIAAGGWTCRLLGDLGLPLRLLRKTLFWLEVDPPELYEPDRLPAYIAEIPGYEFYGFPHFGEPGIKVAVHSGGSETTLETLDRDVSDVEKEQIVEVANRVLKGITGNVLRATTCIYTVTPDHDFIVDRHPEAAHVAFGAGFSGHGFKFTPAVGELLVQLVLGERETLPLFRMDRFAT
jgi:glycine/D-amino acid oxidase-like deaminating enzyme